MGKKSRLKKRRRASRKHSNPSLVLETLRHPFFGLSKAELGKVMGEIGRGQAERFPKTLGSIQELIAKANPLGVLAIMAHYGLLVTIDHDGKLSEAPVALLPAHVEMLQALCLQIPRARIPEKPADVHTMQQIFDLVRELSDQFHSKRFIQIDHAANEAQAARLAVLESIRVATQAVRNWGYLEKVQKLVTDLMQPIEVRFEACHGFKSCELTQIFDFLIKEWTRRLNEHRTALVGMIRARTLSDMVDAYYAAFPGLAGDKEELLQHLRGIKASLEMGKSILMSHADLRLTELSTFTCAEVAAAIKRPVDRVHRAMNRLSLSFGDLQKAKSEHFFLDNPIWTRPLIALSEESYFCVLPQTYFAFWFETTLSLVQENESLLKAYDKRRSSFLEERVRGLFAEAFPHAKIFPNYKWHTPDRTQQFESDLVVGIDSFLVLVEAKSGRVAPESRRGAQDRLGDDIDSLLLEPSRQSSRLEMAILAAQRGDPGTAEFQMNFPLELRDIHRVVRLSVTLEDIGFLQTNVNGLKQACYVPKELLVAPACSVADLEVVFEVLTGVPQRMHYWVQRSEWDGKADYLADEIDLLGTYLKTGLNLGGIEFKAARLFLAGESRLIDEYFEAKREGIGRARPEYQMTAWWRDILQRIEALKPSRWLEVAVALLCASYEQQGQIERRVDAIVADVRKHRSKAASRNGMIFVPSEGRVESIGVIVLTPDQMRDRAKFMENLASQAFASSPCVKQCALLVRDVDEQHYPYSSLGWYWRSV